ncbi:MAG: DNA-processing protein DprA [Candidatus Desulfofervidaceae bacterium]|nr:DNA-processing protein DprA [Candidatus Desulfofervidaceae bacterium]
MSAIHYWLALHYLPGLGNQGCLRLLQHFGQPQHVFSAPEKVLKEAGVKEETIKAIKAGTWQALAQAEEEKLKQLDVELITYADNRYPSLLKEIYDPPFLLYVKGNVELLHTPCVAIVGTRRASFYGIKTATRLAVELAEAGITVVSGLARGIDTAAHKGALQAKGKTIAVLGCGMDIVYPPENKKIYADIARQGAIISEFPLGTPPVARNFPIRNRIITGLSLGVIVVEAALKSGSLITARLALEQGREVFAVPGQIDTFHSKGTHSLIKQGAKLVETIADVLEELNLSVVETSTFREKQETKLDSMTEKLLSLLQEPRQLDEIALSLNQDIAELSATLTTLEIQGLIKQLPGKQYVRAN